MHSSTTRILAAFAIAALASQTSAETLNGLPVEVLARSTVKLPDRVLTLVRIRPPAIPVLPAPSPSPVPAEPSAEEKLSALRREAKLQIQLSMEATIYAGSPTITELTWSTPEGRRFRAYCSIDFTHLSQLYFVETASAVYDWFPFLTDGDPASIPAGVREALLGNGSGAHYLFEGNEADAAANESTLQAIEYLVAYFELHKTELIAATALRNAAAIEQQRLDAIKAAQPKDQTLYFWKNETPMTR
jgi:hypothetical protein